MLLGISALNNSVTCTEQFNGREGETAIFLKTSSVKLYVALAVSPHVISPVRTSVARLKLL